MPTKKATADALSKSEKVEIVIRLDVKLRFDYPSMGLVERWTEEFDVVELERSYADSCEIQFEIVENQWSKLLTKIKEHVEISHELVTSL